MSIFKKIGDIMGVPPDDEDYEEDGTAAGEEEDDFDYVASSDRSDDAVSEGDDPHGKTNRVVNINTTTQLQVVLVKPERFEDASAIADHLNSKRTVVLNLESANKDVARRLVDFLSGVAYANKGQLKRVANNTFIITPYNVAIQGDLVDELQNNGVLF